MILSRVCAFSELGGGLRWSSRTARRAGDALGLTGDEISFGARIVAVADMFDASTADRPYRMAMPVERALQILDERQNRT